MNEVIHNNPIIAHVKPSDMAVQINRKHCLRAINSIDAKATNIKPCDRWR